jgi:TusA-related sulfurtransferase
MEHAPKPSRTVDARGLRCPLPLVRARDEMDLLEPGEILEVLATDPGAEHDLRSWSRRKGHALVSTAEAAGVYRFLIRRA